MKTKAVVPSGVTSGLRREFWVLLASVLFLCATGRTAVADGEGTPVPTAAPAPTAPAPPAEEESPPDSPAPEGKPEREDTATEEARKLADENPEEEALQPGEPIEAEEEEPANPEVGQPTPVPFLPPLSLRDCLLLIDRVLALVPPTPAPEDQRTGAKPAGPPPTPDAPVDSLRRMVISTYNYLTFRDDLHTSLADYEWLILEDSHVQNDPGDLDQDTFSFTPPVRYISAISFEVEDGDVRIYGVRVYDEDDNLRQSFNLERPRRLYHSLPRREVFHLWRRTTISKIVVRYSSVDPDPEEEPKVIVRGGITEKKEYIKTAMHYLKSALTAMEQGDWKKTRVLLEEAKENIVDFIRKNQLRR